LALAAHEGVKVTAWFKFCARGLQHKAEIIQGRSRVIVKVNMS
jgi:hypothetical protein